MALTQDQMMLTTARLLSKLRPLQHLAQQPPRRAEPVPDAEGGGGAADAAADAAAAGVDPEGEDDPKAEAEKEAEKARAASRGGAPRCAAVVARHLATIDAGDDAPYAARLEPALRALWLEFRASMYHKKHQ